MNIDINEITKDMVEKIAFLEFYGIHFINDKDSANKNEVKFSIPKSTELTNDDTKEGKEISFDLSTQEGLISFAKEESWKVAVTGIKAMIQNNDQLKHIIHDNEIDIYLNVIKENTKYLCTVNDIHWTKEKGIEAMNNYINLMAKNV